MNFLANAGPERARWPIVWAAALLSCALIGLGLFVFSTLPPPAERCLDVTLNGPPFRDREFPAQAAAIYLQNRGTEARRRLNLVVNGSATDDWGHLYRTLQRVSQLPPGEARWVIIVPDDAAPLAWVIQVLDFLNELKLEEVFFAK